MIRPAGFACCNEGMAPRMTVASTAITAIAYDPRALIFEVQYSGGKGGVYRYHHVPPEVYADFGRAYSLGLFVNTRVKPYFPCERLTLAQAARRPLYGAGPWQDAPLEGGYTRRRKARRSRSPRPRRLRR